MNSTTPRGPSSTDVNLILQNAPEFILSAHILEEFCRFYPDEMAIFRLLGIYPASGARLRFDPFSANETIDDFSNIGAHNIAVAVAAGILGQLLPRASTENSVREIIKRGLLHDALKAYDIFLTRARNVGTVDDATYYSPEIFEVLHGELMRLGVDAQFAAALIRDYGTETNNRICFDAFFSWDMCGPAQFKAGLWGAKVVHLADNMTASPIPSNGIYRTYFLTTSDRLAVCEANTRYPWGLRAGLAYSPREKKVTHVEEVSRLPAGLGAAHCYHSLMSISAHKISLELALAQKLHLKEEEVDVWARDYVRARAADGIAYLVGADLKVGR